MQRLQKSVSILSENFTPRDYNHLENLNNCADYIKKQFVKAGATAVNYQRFLADGKEYINVCAFFGAKGKKRLVIGAHYDAFETTPGADDNASGVAGLIELAYLLGQNPIPGSIELVAYSLEEPPFFGTSKMGSAIHAEKLDEEGVSVPLMISLEMIGYFTDQPGTQKFPGTLLSWLYPGTGNFLALVGNIHHRKTIKTIKTYMKGTTDLPIYSINAFPTVRGIDFSDHRSYWPYGIPAIMATDTAFYRNEEYHGVRDTADRLDYERMGMVVISVYEAISKFQETNQ